MNLTILNEDVFILDNFLSSEECIVLIEEAEKLNFERATVNLGHKHILNEGVRNNDRLIIFNEEWANQFYKKSKHYLKHEIEEYKLDGLNEMFRYYRYKEGQRFPTHVDGSYYRNENDSSFFTFLIYPNDDFTGGETGFRNLFDIKPTVGSMLVFNHDMWHEGKPILSDTKNVLRTDVMYKK